VRQRDECRDPEGTVFRSGAPVLQELALSHRLSVAAGRGLDGVPAESAFAIQSIKSSAQTIDAADASDLSLRCEIVARRRGSVTAFRATLVTNYGGDARVTVASFKVLPPALANFVRRTRGFLEFADVKIARNESSLAAVAEDQFRYYPSEDDRLSDGRRVDHVPALVLIDIALCVNSMGRQRAACSNLSAEFLKYTDPRVAFDIVRRKDGGAVEFVQEDQLVAIVSVPDRLG
jgi:hypothetical protein